MPGLRFTLKYLYYWFTAQNKHAVHSPFVFDLFTNIIKDTNPFYVYEEIEAIRSELLRSNRRIQVTDHGTGPADKNRKIAEIVRNSATSPKYASLLFRLVNHFKPSTILELGTSLGIGTLYMASVSKNSRIYTVEGCPQAAGIAKQNFSKMNL